MEHTPVNLDNMNIKISIGGLILNVLYTKFDYLIKSMEKHSHSNKSYELHFIPSGQGLLIVNDQEYPIIPGTLYMTGPDVIHEQISIPSDPMAEYCICFEVIANNTSPLSQQNDLSLISKLLIDTPFWFGQDAQNILQLFQQLHYEASQQYIGYIITIKNIIEQILVKLIRNYTHNHPSLITMPLKTLDDKRLVIIENSFLFDCNALTIQKLSKKLGLSIRQTERIIKKYYNTSFTIKKLQSKMSISAHLLSTTSLPVSQIAEQVGFSTLENFCNTFKKYFHVSATIYRTQHPLRRKVMDIP